MIEFSSQSHLQWWTNPKYPACHRFSKACPSYRKVLVWLSPRSRICDRYDASKTLWDEGNFTERFAHYSETWFQVAIAIESAFSFWVYFSKSRYWKIAVVLLRMLWRHNMRLLPTTFDILSIMIRALVRIGYAHGIIVKLKYMEAISRSETREISWNSLFITDVAKGASNHRVSSTE